MNVQAPIRRRDGRFLFNTGDAFVEFSTDGGRKVHARLLDLSTAGLSFEMQEEAGDLRAGAVYHNTIVRVGKCDLSGALALKNLRSPAPGTTRCGCLFYPASPQFELALMALLTGLECSGGKSPDRPPIVPADRG